MSVLKVTTDGDPYPAKAGGANEGGSGQPVNNGNTRFFARGAVISDQNKTYNIDYRGGTGGNVIGTPGPNATGTVLSGNPQTVYINDDGAFEEMPIGVTANGVAIYPPGVKFDPNGTFAGDDRTFNTIKLAGVFGPDLCGGRPEGADNEYRYRSGAFITNGWVDGSGENTFRTSSTYFNSTDFEGDYLRHPASTINNVEFGGGHSKIIGFAFDGYPIYGPFGYSDPYDPSSAVVRMESSYVERSLGDESSERQALANTASRPMGSFIEDYDFVPSVSNFKLDQHNGRYCVTPDYRQGTYAYFLTLDSSNEPEYPYIIGPTTKERRSY